MSNRVRILPATQALFPPNAVATECVICGKNIGEHGAIIEIRPERGIPRYRSICQTHSHDPCLVTEVIHQAQQPGEDTRIAG